MEMKKLNIKMNEIEIQKQKVKQLRIMVIILSIFVLVVGLVIAGNRIYNSGVQEGVSQTLLSITSQTAVCGTATYTLNLNNQTIQSDLVDIKCLQEKGK